jgi:hypothetical protein
MRPVNLTPHVLTLRTSQGEDISLPADPRGPARLVSSAERLAPVDVEGLPIPVQARAPAPTGVEGLPLPEAGVLFIVARPVAESVLVRERGDLVAPGTGPDEGAIRVGGQIVAVTRLIGSPDTLGRAELTRIPEPADTGR